MLKIRISNKNFIHCINMRAPRSRLKSIFPEHYKDVGATPF